ncbi:hypothetical protein ACOMHN_064167 [Nucella lapillus]
MLPSTARVHQGSAGVLGACGPSGLHPPLTTTVPLLLEAAVLANALPITRRPITAGLRPPITEQQGQRADRSDIAIDRSIGRGCLG